MKKFILYALFFLIVLAGSVIAHTPASFVMQYMPVNRDLKISGVSGTIWHGQANKVIWLGKNIGQVNWDFMPSELLKGDAEFSVRFGRNGDLKLTGKGQIGYGFSGPYAENLHASMPAQMAVDYMLIPVPVDVLGSIDLTVKRYTYAEPYCQSGQGALVWNNGQADTPSGVLKLGTVIVDLECQDSRLSAQGKHDVPQLSGAMTAELSPDQRYKLDAWFKPGAEFPKSMRSQLRWLGNPDKKGRYQWVISGKY